MDSTLPMTWAWVPGPASAPFLRFGAGGIGKDRGSGAPAAWLSWKRDRQSLGGGRSSGGASQGMTK